MDVLICLDCRNPLQVGGVTEIICTHCGARYPVVRDVIDCRKAERDVTAGFGIEENNLLVAKMSEVFDETQTFNEMRDLILGFESRQAKGIGVADIDPRAVLREDGIKPRPFSVDDAAHSQAILAKIPLYLEGTHLPDLPKGIALEDGAGLGFFTDGFSKHFEHLFVVDLSMSFLLLARKIVEERGLRNVTLVCANVENLSFQDEAFDFVHSNNVIEHVSRQDLLMSEAHRVLKATGLLMVVSPNRFSLYIEPHWGLPAFGFWPKAISRWVIWKRRKVDIDDISLRSLGQIKALARRHFGRNVKASFIPRRLEQTATGGRLRRSLTAALNMPAVGSAVVLSV